MKGNLVDGKNIYGFPFKIFHEKSETLLYHLCIISRHYIGALLSWHNMEWYPTTLDLRSLQANCRLVCPSIHASIYPCIYHPSIYPTVHPSICPSTHLSICLSTFLSICACMHACICLSIHLPIFRETYTRCHHDPEDVPLSSISQKFMAMSIEAGRAQDLMCIVWLHFLLSWALTWTHGTLLINALTG